MGSLGLSFNFLGVLKGRKGRVLNPFQMRRKDLLFISVSFED